jgi:hypothetical protein
MPFILPEGTTMAEKMRFTAAMLKQNPNLSKFSHYYNIEKAVGSNSPNKRNDVLLIQFMLRIWVKTKESGLADYYDSYVPQHGTFDFTTLSFLLLFQMRHSSAGKVNARFDPLTLQKMDAVNSFLAALNLSIWDQKLDMFKDFAAVPGIPGELIPLLK